MIDAYVWNTPNGYKALLLLEELGLPYRAHWIDITRGDQKTPEYLAINPNGKIPAIVDGDVRVFESGAVAIYLAEKAQALLPPSGPARAEVLAWMFFQVGNTGPIIGQLDHYLKFAKQQVPYAIERYTKEAERLFGVLDTHLAGRQFMVGDSLTLADVMNVTWPITARDFLGFDLTPWPNLVRWMEALEKRESFARALAMKPPER